MHHGEDRIDTTIKVPNIYAIRFIGKPSCSCSAPVYIPRYYMSIVLRHALTVMRDQLSAWLHVTSIPTERKRHMSAPIGETATTVVQNLERIETALIVLFEQQQLLSTGYLSHTEELSLFAAQLHLMLSIKSSVQLAKLAVWSLIVPEAVEGSQQDLTVHHCEPEEEEATE
jgi:hypothetical protein